MAPFSIINSSTGLDDYLDRVRRRLRASLASRGLGALALTALLVTVCGVYVANKLAFSTAGIAGARALLIAAVAAVARRSPGAAFARAECPAGGRRGGTALAGIRRTARCLGRSNGPRARRGRPRKPAARFAAGRYPARGPNRSVGRRCRPRGAFSLLSAPRSPAWGRWPGWEPPAPVTGNTARPGFGRGGSSPRTPRSTSSWSSRATQPCAKAPTWPFPPVRSASTRPAWTFTPNSRAVSIGRRPRWGPATRRQRI